MVCGGILVQAGDVAQRESKEQAQQGREQRQHDGHGHALQQQIRHGAAVLQRGAQIQRDQVLQIDDVLLPEGLVQAHLHAERLDDALTGLFTRQNAGGITGNQVDHQKCDDRDNQQHRDHLQDALQDIGKPAQYLSTPF